MPSIPLPSIKLAKKKDRAIIGEIFTDDGRIVDRELPSKVAGCVDDEKMGNAFLIDSEQQYMAEDGEWHQLFSEKSQIPLSYRVQSKLLDGVNDEKEMNRLGNEIFVQAFEQKQMEWIEKAQVNDTMDKLMTIIIIVCVTGAIIVGMSYLWG